MSAAPDTAATHAQTIRKFVRDAEYFDFDLENGADLFVGAMTALDALLAELALLRQESDAEFHWKNEAVARAERLQQALAPLAEHVAAALDLAERVNQGAATDNDRATLLAHLIVLSADLPAAVGWGTR
jgi:hypothetical protein